MKLSIVICTWNRAGMLSGALSSLAALRIPDRTSWDVIVIDNASTDDTPDTVAGFEGRLPVRRVAEPEPGLSHARNRAIAELDGDYVLWLDDDVVVPPEWLGAYVDAFRAWPDAAVFGGPIRPRLEGTPPPWLLPVIDRVGHAYAALDLGPIPVPLGPSVDRLPFGANFAVRTDEQRLHTYPTWLGRRHGRHAPGGEEIAVIGAILDAGATGRWVPDAGVTHRIGPERQTTRYLRAYAAADALHEELDSPPKPLPRPRASPTLRAVALDLRYRWLRLWTPPGTWIDALLAAGDAWGRARAARGSTRGGPPAGFRP